MEQCKGFRVSSPDGYVGIVEEVLYGVEEIPAALVVSSGLFLKRLLLVGREEVLEIASKRRSLFLRGSWNSSAAEVFETAISTADGISAGSSIPGG
jgi:hypothetical protein